MAGKRLALLLLVCVALSGCAASQGTGEAYPGQDWSYAQRPEDLGWSTEKLAQARAYSERIGSAAVMVVDDGVVVAAWGDISRKYHCHSMRKSLMSALYGIYVAEGKINLDATLKELGIDDRTPLTEVEKTATVKDLLSARSGVYIEAAGEAEMMKAMRPERGSHAPGTFWYYNNWDFNALGTIFDRLSGEKDIYTAFNQRIADPIGMQDYDPDQLHYGYESYSVHPYYGFRLSARDAARFGLLFLRDGRWNGKQVVPEDWVKESTSAHSQIGPESGYGYMWWLGEGQGGFPNVDEGPGSYYASGAYGQEIIVMPARDLVVVHRVNSDVGDSVGEEQIGTLLWLILDAAGEKDIGQPVQLDRAEGTRLTGDALRQALPGRIMLLQQPGVELWLEYGQDDTLTVRMGDLTLAQGRWWSEGDSYCHDLGQGLGGSRCFRVVQDGGLLRLFDQDGYLAREGVMMPAETRGL